MSLIPSTARRLKSSYVAIFEQQGRRRDRGRYVEDPRITADFLGDLLLRHRAGASIWRYATFG